MKGGIDMKVLNITYETAVIEDGKKAYGEACMDVPMMDELADRLMNNIPCGIDRKSVV